MRTHWVLLITCAVILPVEAVVLALAAVATLGSLHLPGHAVNGFVFWLLFFAVFGLLQYISLRITRPYDLILWLLRRGRPPGSAG